MKKQIPEISVTSEKIIRATKGDVYRIIRQDSKGFSGFSELYLTQINAQEFKGWKKHNRATLNLFVVSGSVDFFVRRDLNSNVDEKISINSKSGLRLTVPPGNWLGFYSENGASIINFCNVVHDPTECETVERF